MPNSPPVELAQLLEQLGLATSGQLASVAPAVRQLVGDLPEFESVWIDALTQRRLLTPFQASWLNAGRGAELRVGPYVLRQRLLTPAWADCYRAAHHESQRNVELLAIRSSTAERGALVAQTRHLIEQMQLCTDEALLAPLDRGECNHGVWIVAPDWQGKPASDWLAEHGRFPVPAVLHIAREVLAVLARLHHMNLLHTGLCAQALVIDGDQVKLRHAGLRALARPADGYSMADLPPSAYEGVAPEWMATVSQYDLASEIFAFGCLLWHLLTGRPPFAGGNALTKLRSIHECRLPDLRGIVPDAPEALVRLIVRCLARDRELRPTSWQEIGEALGPSNSHDRAAYVRAVHHPRSLYRRAPRRRRTMRNAAVAVTALAACAAATTAAWPDRQPTSPLLIPRKSVALALVPTQSKPAESQPQYDPQVHLASATEPIPAAEVIEPVLLPSGHVVELAGLDLQPGQVVQADKGARSIVRVPRDGLLVTAENIRFENVDFIWDDKTPPAQGRSRCALIVLEANRCEFRCCTFQSVGASVSTAAIVWQSIGNDETAETKPGELVLSNCHFSGLAAVVVIERSRSASIDVSNSLLTRCDTLCRTAAFPELGTTVSLSLEHVTLRDHGPVCVVPAQASDQPGQLIVRSGGSVLALRDGDPLVALVGAKPTAEVLAFLRWQGEGSLLLPETTVAAWQNPSGLTRPIRDELLAVAGLVRGDVDFASDNPQAAASSRVTSWQAPLRSSQPPGIVAGVPDLPLIP